MEENYSESGLACIKKGMPFPLQENVWFITTSMFFSNILNIQNNGLLVKADGFMIAVSTSPHFNSSHLLQVNLPKIGQKGFKAVKDLCEFEGVELKYMLVTGDWHHFSIHSWQEQFPQAKLYLASERNLKQNKKIDRRDATVLDSKNPAIPELADVFELIPVLGCVQPSSKAEQRIEVIVFHKESGILFITDHCFPGFGNGMMGLRFGRKVLAQDFYITPNFAGFKIGNQDEAAVFAKRVLGIQGIKKLIFAHKKPSNLAIYSGDKIMQALREGYETHFIE